MAGTMVQPVDAGDFAEWLSQARAALRGTQGMNVPCGECTGCCTSGYSVQLRLGDSRALAKIPVTLLVQAPGFPADQRTLEALPNGLCPMLHGGKCSIYEERPQTCLDYDCRVFAAAGIDAGENKPAINSRVRAWRFTYSTHADRQAHQAVMATARFIRDRRSAFRAPVPGGPMGVAVLAIKSYRLFPYSKQSPKNDAAIAEAIVAMALLFDTGKPSRTVP
jgi:Fe-S-cluster containining protein